MSSDEKQPGRTGWGAEPGSIANGICNLIWILALTAAVIYFVVALVWPA